ncbi:MAG: DUF229 domain-containing protein [Myxococcales bacterium]|nr:MAG: DUF229 domain-containing protein [Myxococcales bacterium]
MHSINLWSDFMALGAPDPYSRFGEERLPSVGGTVAGRVYVTLLAGLVSTAIELFFLPGEVASSGNRLVELFGASCFILATYLVCTMAAGVLWGLWAACVQRVFHTVRPWRRLLDIVFPPRRDGWHEASRTAAFLTGGIGLAVFLAVSAVVVHVFLKAKFQNLSLASLTVTLSVFGLAAATAGFCLPLYLAFRGALRRLLEWRLTRPLVRFKLILALLAAFAVASIAAGLVFGWHVIVQIKDYDAWLMGGALVGALFALAPFRVFLGSGVSPRLVRLGSAAWPAVFVIAVASMIGLAENQRNRYIVFQKSLLAGHLLTAARQAQDFDLDRYPALLGGGDCAPFDDEVYPDALEKPGNDKDDNCVGGDRPRGSWRNSDVPAAVSDEFAARRDSLNVLLLTIDAVRARNTSLYGYPRPTTKTIEEWADKRNAYVFDRAYCHVPATRWTIPQILTSLYPSDVYWDTKTFPHTVQARNLMLAEVLKKHDFYTAAYWTMDKRMWGLDQGFDKFTNEGADKKSSGGLVTDYAVKFLEHNQKTRFFLWLHYYEPHDTYETHAGINFGKEPMDRYDGEIQFVDQQLKSVFEKLEQLGLWETTIIVLTADHGEEFLEHGKRFHSYQLYEESVHVPLVWWLPGGTGGHFSQTVGHLDFMPTLLNLLGYSDGWKKFRGKSYAELFFAPEQYVERPVFLSTSWTADYPGGSIKGVIDDEWKLLYNVRSQVYELYNVKTDPLEKNNLYEPEAEAVQRLLPALYREIDEIRSNKTFGKK